MIVLNIQSEKIEDLEKAASILLKERLAIDINLQSDVTRYVLKGDQVGKRVHHVLRAKTKALLFPAIERRLREVFKGGIPELFSVPIIHMDWDQTLQLRQDTEGV